ncbi:DUF6567 family protein [Ohtaekwangia koreensis]|jgi:hypothetical protein|uniref:Lipoprotein n=1 Tax=Ohtaekwangia koreensis TaxID=688867 RepID=A0A1T5J5J4_9BACT|nr:DUF6567 family protein [Ohtaekwangia koreensis]SKC46664.1 hypothetical protein SAMN05660236_0773 [Ohtaekwangia koreensis]
MKINQLMVVAAMVLLSSCAAHVGTLTSNVSLNQANFRVVSTATGSAQTKLVLGFGGLKKEALVAEAKKDLIAKANLTPTQVLANISVDYKTSIYPGFIPAVVINKVILTADVIEFTK